MNVNDRLTSKNSDLETKSKTPTKALSKTLASTQVVEEQATKKSAKFKSGLTGKEDGRLKSERDSFSHSPNVELAGLSRPSRVVIDRISPEIDGGRFAAKVVVNEPVNIKATLLIDGHDKIKARLHYKHESDTKFETIPLVLKHNDEWWGTFTPSLLGRHVFTIEACIDRFGTWRSDVTKKLAAGQDINVDLQSGVLLLEDWSKSITQSGDWSDAQSVRRRIDEKIAKLKSWVESTGVRPDGGRADTDSKPILSLQEIETVTDDSELLKMNANYFEDSSCVTLGREVPLQVEPLLSRFSSWYEFFPRSASAEPGRHGTFRDAEERLDYVASMGFDVVYFPPIHPIGREFRKGKNNSLKAEKGDVGSPWAIGAKEGGHRSLHPDLGTFEDFDRLVDKAKDLGIEIAMDIAFQCAPDHPYVKEHPEWFKKRPDGTIQYAENPPKKYQDIYPFDFESSDWRGLWTELYGVIEFWVDRGVRVFRVDNPHTKSLHFWEWCIREIRSRHPDVIFLSEAFTRPHLMAYLAKAGFSQSYTYFSWRNTKWELTQYLTELTKTELIDYFGANFWPNTPDILPEPLHADNRAIYMQRVILASMLSSSYGIYGPVYELMVHRPKAEGSEEYLDSEKYQLQNWRLDDPNSLAPLLKRLNEIRRQTPALQNNRSLEFLPISNESLLAFCKSDGDEKVIIVVNLDPHHSQSGMLELPLIEWGIDPQETFQVHDLLTDARYFWSGWRNYVELNPQTLPAHVFMLKRHTRTAEDFEYFL